MSTTSAAALSALIGSMYDAALDPSGAHWSSVLAQVGRAVGAHGWAALALQRERHDYSRIIMHNIDESAARAYAGHYMHLDKWLAPALAASASGTACYTDALVPPRAFRKTEFFNDWLQPRDVCSGVGVVMYREPSAEASLYLAREIAMGPFEHDDTALLSLLLPHVQRAIHLSVRLTQHAAPVHDATALAHLAQPLLVVHGSGHVVYTNHAAERLLNLADGLVTAREIGDQRGRLCGTTPPVTNALRGLIANAAATSIAQRESAIDTLTRAHASGGALVLSRPSGKPDLVVMVAPFRARTQGSDSVFAHLVPASDHGCAIVSVIDATQPVDAENRDAVLAQCLRVHYGLTESEAAVALAIAEGDGLEAVAGQRAVTLATVRTQAQRIYDKTGVRGQAALAHRLGQLRQSLLLRSP